MSQVSAAASPVATPNAAPSASCLACGRADSTPWAEAHDVEYLTTSDAFTYRRCQSCGVLFIDPVPEGRLSEIYPTNYYSYAAPGGSPIHAIKSWLDRRLFRGILSQLTGEDLRVLDVGGGAGWELRTLRESDSRVRHTHVVDLDPGAAELAAKNGHQYFCGRIEDFSTNEHFDLIVLLNLIEHVRDPAHVLRKVASLLSPNGLVLVKTPNYEALDATLFRRHSWAGLHCPRHWVLFTMDSFVKLAQECGLTIRKASFTQGAPFWAASTLAWLGERGLVKISKERPVFYHPLFGPLAGLFAALDFVRRPFAKTSQMFFVLGRGIAVEAPSLSAQQGANRDRRMV
jgi:2-polyprenyl-3-methyl-5-hydroxy-6-metoxy-1,4-benzoquinol methylase